MDVLQEMSLQRSIYHFYMWKEAQTLEYERSLLEALKANQQKSTESALPANNKPNQFNTGTILKTGEADETQKYDETVHTKIPESGQDNSISNSSQNDMSAKEKMTSTVGDGKNSPEKQQEQPPVVYMSAKYRRVLNVLKKEFPSIDSACQPLGTIPDVYYRYSMYPKICHDYEFLRQQYDANIRSPLLNATRTKANNTATSGTAHNNSKKRKQPVATSQKKTLKDPIENEHNLTNSGVAPQNCKESQQSGGVNSMKEAPDDPAITTPKAQPKVVIAKRTDVPDDVKEQFMAVQSLARKNRKYALSLKQRLEKQKRAKQQAEQDKTETEKQLLVQEKEASKQRMEHEKLTQKLEEEAKTQAQEKQTIEEEQAKQGKKKKNPNFPSSFEERLELLKHYKDGYGHCRVRPTHDKSLNIWVSHLRSCYKRLNEYPQDANRTDSTLMGLTPERIDELDKLGFEWCVSTPIAPWEERYEQLKQYQQEHGHCRVPRGYKMDNSSLGEWVHSQRKNRASQSKALTMERIAKLDSIGFVWNPPAPQKAYTWEIRMEQCLKYRREHGHLNVPNPKAKTENGGLPNAKEMSFRRWAFQIRHHYRRFMDGKQSSRLDRKRIKQLQELGFVFDADLYRKHMSRMHNNNNNNNSNNNNSSSNDNETKEEITNHDEEEGLEDTTGAVQSMELDEYDGDDDDSVESINSSFAPK